VISNLQRGVQSWRDFFNGNTEICGLSLRPRARY
jgi:hypothetical protein